MLRSLMILVLVLGVSCSSPLRETSEPSQPVEQQEEAKPVAVAVAPPPPRPVVVDDPPITAPEIPPLPVAETAAEAPPAKRAPVVVDPVKELFAEEARRVERERTIASLAAARDAAAADVMRREKDLLAMKNPFLPRPRLAPDEQAELQGLGGAARAKWGEAQVAEARALLEAAEKALAEAKANQ